MNHPTPRLAALISLNFRIELPPGAEADELEVRVCANGVLEIGVPGEGFMVIASSHPGGEGDADRTLARGLGRGRA